MFTGRVPSSQVLSALATADLFVANVAFFRGQNVTRVTHALPSRLGLMKLGLHNPHYATFGRADLLKSKRFSLVDRAADIEYFINVFQGKPRVSTV